MSAQQEGRDLRSNVMSCPSPGPLSGSRLLVCTALLMVCGAAVRAQPGTEELHRWLEEGRHQEVVDAVAALERRDGASVSQLLTGAEAALKMGRLQDARSFTDSAREADPESAEAATWQGHVLMAMGESRLADGRTGLLTQATFQDAASAYRQARKLGGDAYRNAYWEAEAQELGGSPEEALQALEAALEARPEDPGARLLKGRILLRAERPLEAARTLQGLLDAEPGHQEAAGLLVRARIAAGDQEALRSTVLELASVLGDAGVIFQPLYSSFWSDPAGRRMLADLLEEVRARTSAELLPRFYLGCLRLVEGRPEEAVPHLKAYVEAAGTDATGHRWLGVALTQAGQLDAARKELMKANTLGGVDPEEMATSYRELVTALVEAGRYEDAVVVQRLVVSLTDRPWDVMDLGALQVNAGHREEGMRTYRRVIERKDADAAVVSATQNSLGLALWGLGRLQEAEAALRAALATSERNLDARENLGILLLQLGREKKAAAQLERVSEMAASRGEGPRRRAAYHLLRIRYPVLLDGAGSRGD